MIFICINNHVKGSRVSKVLEKVSGKWKVSVLESLESKELRFTDLRESLPGVSNKVLSEALKDLESEELIKQNKDDEYKLTKKGFSLLDSLESLEKWFKEYEESEKEILILEDDDSQARLYKNWLGDFGVTICRHETVFECFSNETSLVIMDRDLPGVETGIILSRIRDAGIPVIMVSGVEPGPEIVDFDVQDYLLKPVSKEELLNSVNKVEELDDLGHAETELKKLNSKMDVLKKKYSREEMKNHDKFSKLIEKIEKLESESEDP